MHGDQVVVADVIDAVWDIIQPPPGDSRTCPCAYYRAAPRNVEAIQSDTAEAKERRLLAALGKAELEYEAALEAAKGGTA